MTNISAWQNLQKQGRRLNDIHLRDLFDSDASRFNRFSYSLDDLFIDFSKERLDVAALEALFGLARDAGLEGARELLFSGARYNNTEDRAVLHMALRGGIDPAHNSTVADAMSLAEQELKRMLSFADDVRSGAFAANDGGRFTHVVNIGIGGSDLGPTMCCRALTSDLDGPKLHFVSNMDGSHISDTLRYLDPQRTLILVASKSFSTLETMTNAATARHWLTETLGENAGKHMAALSTNLEATAAYGIDNERVFGFWDWVGGRYSIWSSIGLPLAIGVGSGKFRDFLRGGRDMDRHFQSAPMTENLPILLALVGIWRRNVMDLPTVAVIPYDQRLSHFSAYLQQLEMESNGKRIRRNGAPVARRTAAIIWGEPGSNSQHSFFQLLHQGTDIVPVDFLLAAEPRENLGDHHIHLSANCLSQAQALAFGKTESEVRTEMAAKGHSETEIEALCSHRAIPGNRPSTTILYQRMDAYTLGRLVALYEHKVFCQGVIWDINSYDQWGVELGKQLAPPIAQALKDKTQESDTLDASTSGLLAKIRQLRGDG